MPRRRPPTKENRNPVVWRWIRPKRLIPLALATGLAILPTAAHASSEPATTASPNGVQTSGAYACRQDVSLPNPAYPRVHAATLAEAPNHDLITAFYGGESEGSADQAIYMSRMKAGQRTWQKPTVLFDEPGKADGNPILWTNGSSMYLFFVTIFGHGWEQASIRMIRSDDNGHSWSAPVWIRQEWGWMTGTPPIRMSNGEILLPIYNEAQATAGFYVFNSDLTSWTAYPADTSQWIHSPNGSIQPTVVELEPGHLLAYLRTGDGRIYQSESTDYARTWSPATPTDVGNPDSRVAMLKLTDGNLVLAYNPWVQHHSPLALSMSPDKAVTWAYTVDVEAQPGPQFTYPYMIQTSDGFIHMVYSYNRDDIRHVVFNEKFLTDGISLLSNYPEHTTTELINEKRRDVNKCQYRMPQ